MLIPETRQRIASMERSWVVPAFISLRSAGYLGTAYFKFRLLRF
jgi:hypothetical protein